jgi:hypothetical protein
MTGRITADRRRGITVALDAVHRTPGGPKTIMLPTSYVGGHVDYGYARTVDTAQGATVDHSLFTPSTGASGERAYVALSRGRLSNRLYATRDSAWIAAIGEGRGHALALDQEPAVRRAIHRSTHRRAVGHDREHPARLELEL